MKTAIVYASSHHGNTRKLVEAICQANEVTAIDALANRDADLQEFDRIAAGVAFSKYYPAMLTFLEKNLPENKQVFFMHTAGAPRENHNGAALAIAQAKGCQNLGTFFCKGHDTYGVLKWFGGINKKHPNEKDLANAVAFYQGL